MAFRKVSEWGADGVAAERGDNDDPCRPQWNLGARRWPRPTILNVTTIDHVPIVHTLHEPLLVDLAKLPL
jgi:hypothetical protein